MQAFRKPVMRTIPEAVQAPFPAFIEPMHPTQYARLPTGAQWQYEIKLDGWRGQLHLAASSLTSDDADWTWNARCLARFIACGVSSRGQINVEGVADFKNSRDRKGADSGRL